MGTRNLRSFLPLSLMGCGVEPKANPAFERDSPEAGEPLNFTLALFFPVSL